MQGVVFGKLVAALCCAACFFAPEMPRAQALSEETRLQALIVATEQTKGASHPDVADSLNDLALLLDDQGRHAEAAPLHLRALAIREQALGPAHPAVAQSLNNLAGHHDALGRFTQAEALYRRALAIDEQALGADHPEVAYVLNNLALLHYSQGRYAIAEPLYQRSLAIREKIFGSTHAAVANALNNLAGLYDAQGRDDLAEPLYQRSLAIEEQVFGPNHPAVATSLNNLAALYKKQGRYLPAEPLYRRSRAIREQTFGLEHPAVAQSLNNLAGLLLAQNRAAEAEPLYRGALAIVEKVYGPEHPATATTLNNLAGSLDLQGDLTGAEPLYRRALAIREQVFSPDHPDIAASLNNLASVHETRGEIAVALALIRRASAIYRQRIVVGGSGDTAAQEANRGRIGFYRHLALLGGNAGRITEPGQVDETFAIAQLAQATGTGAAVAKMAARFAHGDDAIAVVVKHRQDAVEQRVREETRLVKAVSQPTGRRDAATEALLRARIQHLGAEIANIDAELNLRFPEYQELIRPEPVAVAQVQALLRSDEAMLVYAVGDKGSWLWVVRSDRAVRLPLDRKRGVLEEQVRRIRTQVDGSMAEAVDVTLLHALYQALLVAALPDIADARHLLLVPSGPLQSLPFHMLAATPPAAPIRSDADYRSVDWLAKRYALSVLPSVGALRALRLFAHPISGSEAFIGFGDPLLQDVPETRRGVPAPLRFSGLFRNLQATEADTAITEIADVQQIRQQARLPETADELRAMARIVGTGEDVLWLQARATEANVKRLDLTPYRIVAFATHGVMADELGAGLEPGLLLTPPMLGSADDDGYLAAGEIARLKLNADWVLLSACNTAAADGAPGAEGMSGLAKAFFYAGSRALLVSHWPVASEATVLLTTTMLREHARDPNQGKAEAHRKAMLSLMHTPGHPEYAHPFYWAPFVVVGEGGTGTQENRSDR